MNIDLKSKSRNLPLLAVSLMIFAHALINFIWLKNDSFPLWFDFGGYFKRSLEIYYASQNNFAEFFRAILGIGRYIYAYQPHRLILPLFSLPWYYIWGISADVAVMSCTSFLAISLFALYGIASRIFGRTTGVLAAFILSVSPGFFTFYRRYSPEFAATAMVAFTAYLLLRAQNFQNRKFSVLSGLTFGISMITKEMSFAFIPGIVAYAVLRGSKEKKGWLLNFCLFLFSSAVVTFFVYWLHNKEITKSIFSVVYSQRIREAFGMPNRFSVDGVLFYLKDIAHPSLLNFSFVFFIFGLFLLIKEKAYTKGFFYSWLIGSYAILILTQTRATYYAMPLLIPVSIITSYGLMNVFKNFFLKKALIAAIVLWGIIELLIYSFPVLSPKYRLAIFPDGYSNYFYPRKEEWQLANIADYLRENANDKEKVYRVHVGANTTAFSAMTLAYTATQKKMNALFAGSEVKLGEIPYFDFVIIKSGENQGMFYSLGQANELIELLDKNEFIKLPKTFILPDNSAAIIYKKMVFKK